MDEARDEVVACMHSRGWTEVSGQSTAQGGGIELGLMTEDQAVLADSDLEECWEISAAKVAPVTAESAERYVDEFFDAANCLEEQGVDVPPGPSREVVVDRVVTTGNENWDVYRYVLDGSRTQDEHDELLRACPMPGLYN